MANTSMGFPLIPDSTKVAEFPKAVRQLTESMDDVLAGELTGELVAAAEEAAADAVDNRIDSVDLVRGSDTRLPRNVEQTSYGIPFTDMDGYVSGGVLDDGVWNFEKPPLVYGQPNATLAPISEHTTAWAIPFADEAGYVAGGIRPDGTAEFFKLKPTRQLALAVANLSAGFTRSSRRRIATIGDSLTNGYFGGSSGHTADAYPATLAELVPAGVEVFNISSSGFTVDEEAARIGALPMALTLDGGRIPSSGPVSATLAEPIGWGDGATSWAGTLAGIPGRITRAAGSTAVTFTRSASGSVVTVPAGTVFVPDLAGHAADTAVIMLGRNDVAQSVTGRETSVAAHIAAGVHRIVEWLSADIKQVVVMSVTTSTGEVAGSANHAVVTEANRLLADLYPTRFLDIRQYLVDRAIYDLGITPTQTDLAKMAGDTLPPSIMDPGRAGTGDGTHYSKATAALVGRRVHEFITSRDWI